MNALFSHLFLLNPCIYIHVSSYGSDNTVLNKNNVPLAALFSLPFPNSQQLTSWQEIPGHDTTSVVPGMDLAELAEQREELDKTLFCNSSFGGLPLQAVFLEKKIPWESTFWNKLRNRALFHSWKQYLTWAPRFSVIHSCFRGSWKGNYMERRLLAWIQVCLCTPCKSSHYYRKFLQDPQILFENHRFKTYPPVNKSFSVKYTQKFLKIFFLSLFTFFGQRFLTTLLVRREGTLMQSIPSLHATTDRY